jgi:sugar/nucleoside kinase (ribokinase family)
MALAEYKIELQNFLNQNERKILSAVVMPDFFLDRLLDLPWYAEEFQKMIADVTARKGGSIDGLPQVDIKGGNAVNTASALAALGVKVTPIICTSNYGLHLLKYHFKDGGIDLSHVKIVSKASITTAFELKTDGGKINVMLRDVGDLADFSPENLDEGDYAAIDSADYVCLFNWAGTKKFGTALARKVFEKAKAGKAKTYCDTADPLPNRDGINELIKTVLTTNNVDILSLNENEAVCYASLLDNSIEARKGKIGFTELALEAARILSRHFPARIDLHTTTFSASLKGTSEVVVPASKVKVLRATGAGDAWNAGNVLGDANGLSDGCRLMLANTVSACYLSDPDGRHPSLSKLASFLSANVQG